jgi:hypothetical protein
MKIAALCFAALCPTLIADVATLQKETNAEKRSELALEEAERELDNARASYKKGDDQGFRDSLASIRAAVELSYDSLKSTGKNARRHPKYYKRADLRIRALLRRIEGLEQEVGFDDRPRVTAVKNRMSEINEQIVLDIMKK